MCGIAGIFSYHNNALEVDQDELRRIRDHMAARGPDKSSEWYSTDYRVGFGNRRLSIIDLSERATQPMQSADGNLVITFNGEIYNYQMLREELQSKGRLFRTCSDTEVLLHLYADRGAAMVHDLRGMFAFALWDAHKRVVLLARDPYGIKPLYYSDDGKTLRFASQVKALLAGGKVSRVPEPAGLVGFYLFGSIPEPYTKYQEVHALPAGSTLRIGEAGSCQPKRYFSIAETFCQAGANAPQSDDNDLLHQSRDSLLDSVRHHLVSDVPVGAFLSAGVDSGALVGLMRDAGQNEIQTVTLAFEEFRGKPNDESPLAEKVAAHYHTRHTTRTVTEQEFRGDLSRILDAMDQPSIDGINTWFVSKAARELGLKVALSGLGGDELFGGYPSFRDIPRWVRLFSVPARVHGLGQAVRRLGSSDTWPWSSINPKAFGLIEYAGTYPGAYLIRRGLFMPWELPRLMEADLASEGLRRLEPLAHIGATLTPDPGTPYRRVATLEASLYMRNQLLRDADWAGMAHSLEIRVPFVDAVLLRTLASQPISEHAAGGKVILAGAPSLGLPREVTDRKKTGFSTPIQDWITKEHRDQSIDGYHPKSEHWSRRWARYVMEAS